MGFSEVGINTPFSSRSAASPVQMTVFLAAWTDLLKPDSFVSMQACRPADG